MKKLFTQGLFLSLLIGSGITASAQNFNYRYVNDLEYNVAQPQGKSIVEFDGNCGIATVNSLRNSDGFYDFQVTFLEPDGSLLQSYTFGYPTRNEFCHGVCKSIEYNDQLLLCGKSSNDQFLVIKIDLNGNVIWSKEIVFPVENAEAITIFPVDNTAFPKGYIVVGNSNSVTGANAVAAVKLDESGVVDWSAQYSMGTKILMTDAIIGSNYNDRIFTVVGNEQANGIFYMNVYANTGNIFYYPGAKFSLPTQEPLYNAHLTEINDNGDRHHILTFGRSTFTPNSVGVYAMRLEGYSSFSPIWAKHYEQTGQQHGYINSDLQLMSTNSASLVGGISTLVSSVPTLVQTINPYVLNIDFDGNLNSTVEYNAGGYEFTGSLIESCNSGYEVFNSFSLESGSRWDLRVIKKDNPGPVGCSTNLPWADVVEEVEENPLGMVAQFSGVAVDHPLPANQIDALKYDCNGGLVLVRADDPGEGFINDQAIANLQEEGSTTNWFYPNPATNQLTIEAGSATSLIQVFDPAGRLVIKREVTGQLTIALSNLEPNVYIIFKQDENGQVHYEKLVIQ